MNRRKWILVINEQHKLLEKQETLLNSTFGAGGWAVISVPAEGWKLEKIREIAASLPAGTGLVFASPIPALMVEAVKNGRRIKCLHNDRREKVELPDGRVTYKIPADGWVIV